MSPNRRIHNDDSKPNSRGFGWRLEVRDLDLFEIERRRVVAFRPRLFSIMDEWTRYPIDIVPISDENSVIVALKKLVKRCRAPEKFHCLDVPEFTSEAFVRWATSRRIRVEYITTAELATEVLRAESLHRFRSIQSSPKWAN